MQEIQLLTREDIAEVVSHELREHLQTLQGELIESLKTGIVESLQDRLRTIVEAAVAERLESLQQEVLAALEEAVRRVIQEHPLAAPDGRGEGFQQ